jgi:predicted O-methyltransferase YrrM
MSFAWSRKFKFRGNVCDAKDPGTVWTNFIKVEDRPINYMEIGVLTGNNTLRVLPTFCKHPQSKLYCVDPWMDYEEYVEYKFQQNQNYRDFLFNVIHSGNPQKYIIKKGFSEDVVPTFEDNFFDLIFIDGNHETEFVYKDGVMSLQKLKSGGYIVFDDYDWKETKEGIDKFLEEYTDQIEILGKTAFQLFIRKL